MHGPEAMISRCKGLRGFLIDTPTPGTVRGVRDGALLIEDGKILDAGEYERIKNLPEAKGLIWHHGEASVILPGLIDLHTHLPQYPAVGRIESSIPSWLERRIFPLERNFNAAAARRHAPAFFEALAKNGTTTAVIYAAIYEESCHECFAAAEKSGMRTILGNILMDRGSYGTTAPKKILSASIEESKRLISKWHGKAHGRLEYAVSPRSAVFCSDEMLKAAATLARDHGTYLQTHLSDNRDEIARIRGLLPQFGSALEIYFQCGIPGPKTILGHCIHQSDEELKKLGDSGSIAAHCPTSDLYLRSGIMPLDRWQKTGLPIGLGSNVAAGPELSLWRVMRCALESQVARSFYEPCEIPSPGQLFSLATLGAAKALGKESEIGTLDPGKSADLVVMDLATVSPAGRSRNPIADLSSEEILSTLIHRGGPHATASTYVCGVPTWIAPPPQLL